MPTATRQANIRALSIYDVGLLLKAQEASSFEMDAMSMEDIVSAVQGGNIHGLILEDWDRQVLLCWQMDGNLALFSALYREGPPHSLMSDLRRILDRAEGILREFGVTRVFCNIGIGNPNFQRLVRLYAKFGFGADLLRLAKGI